MKQPSFRLEQRAALVTGSSQGIGFALASALAHAGAEVILNGRDATKLASAAQTLGTELGRPVRALAFDVTREDEVRAALSSAGPIDILVNNTGIHRRGPLAEMSLADWDLVVQTNLTSAFLVTRSVIGGMRERKAGKVINICSLMSELARPTTGNYAAAKGGLKMLTRAMCAEWAADNIQCNAISPGYIHTELTAKLVADHVFDKWIRGRTPAGRWGRVDDLTGACVFLASPAADFINGQVLTVDGGLTSVV